MHGLIRHVAHYASMAAEGVAVIIIMAGIIGSISIYARKTLFIKVDYPTVIETASPIPFLWPLNS